MLCGCQASSASGWGKKSEGNDAPYSSIGYEPEVPETIEAAVARPEATVARSVELATGNRLYKATLSEGSGALSVCYFEMGGEGIGSGFVAFEFETIPGNHVSLRYLIAGLKWCQEWDQEELGALEEELEKAPDTEKFVLLQREAEAIADYLN